MRKRGLKFVLIAVFVIILSSFVLGVPIPRVGDRLNDFGDCVHATTDDEGNSVVDGTFLLWQNQQDKVGISVPLASGGFPEPDQYFPDRSNAYIQYEHGIEAKTSILVLKNSKGLCKGYSFSLPQAQYYDGVSTQNINPQNWMSVDRGGDSPCISFYNSYDSSELSSLVEQCGEEAPGGVDDGKDGDMEGDDGDAEILQFQKSHALDCSKLSKGLQTRDEQTCLSQVGGLGEKFCKWEKNEIQSCTGNSIMDFFLGIFQFIANIFLFILNLILGIFGINIPLATGCGGQASGTCSYADGVTKIDIFSAQPTGTKGQLAKAGCKDRRVACTRTEECCQWPEEGVTQECYGNYGGICLYGYEVPPPGGTPPPITLPPITPPMTRDCSQKGQSTEPSSGLVVITHSSGELLGPEVLYTASSECAPNTCDLIKPACYGEQIAKVIVPCPDGTECLTDDEGSWCGVVPLASPETQLTTQLIVCEKKDLCEGRVIENIDLGYIKVSGAVGNGFPFIGGPRIKGKGELSASINLNKCKTSCGYYEFKSSVKVWVHKDLYKMKYDKMTKKEADDLFDKKPLLPAKNFGSFVAFIEIELKDGEAILNIKYKKAGDSPPPNLDNFNMIGATSKKVTVKIESKEQSLYQLKNKAIPGILTLFRNFLAIGAIAVQNEEPKYEGTMLNAKAEEIKKLIENIKENEKDPSVYENDFRDKVQPLIEISIDEKTDNNKIKEACGN